MKPNRIRALAICAVRDGERVLLQNGFDAVKNEHFYRPAGGAIEFGERAEEALRREFREEFGGAELRDVRQIGVMENVFAFNGQRGHEILFVFEGRFVDPALTCVDELAIHEGGETRRATWVTLDALKTGARPLYPDGLLKLLLSV